MKPMIPLLSLAMMIGCNSESARVSRIAEQAMHEQAAQNAEMARLNREIAEATERLVAADADARQEILKSHQSLVEQRDALEQERRQMASERVTESILAPIFWHLGTLLLCLLPIVLAIAVLRQNHTNDAEIVNEILIQELVAEEPKLLVAPRAIPRLSSAEEADPLIEDT